MHLSKTLIAVVCSIAMLMLFCNQQPTSSSNASSTHLNYYGAQLEDISFLENEKDVVFLNLAHNKFPDLSPLSGMSKLEHLDLRDCQNFKDLSPLAELTNLKYLDLGQCDQSLSLESLAGLSQLTYLSLRYCDSITDVSPLAGLSNLEYLDLGGCRSLTNVAWLDSLELIHK